MIQDGAAWRAFVLAYGYRVPVEELAAIVGREKQEIRALRNSGAVAQLPQRLPYAALFAAWHGRAPEELDFPVPKRHPGGYAWEPPELALLATLTGQFGTDALASILTARLRARTGDPQACRTHNSVLVALQRIGLQAGDLVGGISVQQAAREIGSENIVRAANDRGSLRTERVGHRVLIPHAIWATWKAGRKTPSPDWVRLSSLRQGLGITSDKLPEFAKAGHIPGAEQFFADGGKHGVWYVAPNIAQQLLDDRHQGRPMPWHGKPLETNLKQTYQRWCERRHPGTCEDCARIWGDHGAPDALDEFKLRYPALTPGEKRHLTRLPLNKTGAGAAAGQAQQRYTLREAADQLAMTVAWVRERIALGTIVVVQGDKGQPLVTEAMMKRLRHVWIYRDDDPEPMPTDWLSASAGAREAGVAQATLLKWAESGELERHASPAGWRFQREAVRERARSYWQTVRFKRATPPDWLAAELRARQLALLSRLAYHLLSTVNYQRCGAREELMNPTTTTERRLLELAAQVTGFEYMFYASKSYHLASGLLYSSPNGQTRVWNPLINDADLLQLAVAVPTISLQDIIVEASRIEVDDAARRAYVREHFVRAVTQAGSAMAKTVTVVNNDSPVPTP